MRTCNIGLCLVVLQLAVLVTLQLYTALPVAHTPNRSKSKKKKSKPQIAAYSYSFGNFRDEINLSRESSIPLSSEYDWHFFTDLNNANVSVLTAKGWHVHIVPTVDSRLLAILDQDATNRSSAFTANLPRVRAKWFKFGHIPYVLKQYDYIIHLDFSLFGENRNYFHIPTPAYVYALINKYPHIDIFNCKHKDRDFMTQEWSTTLLYDMENRQNLAQFEHDTRAAIGRSLERIPVFVTGVWMRKVRGTPEMERAFLLVFTLMVKYGLNRDQNVFGFACLQALPNPGLHIATVFSQGLNSSGVHQGQVTTVWPTQLEPLPNLRIAIVIVGVFNRFYLNSTLHHVVKKLSSQGHSIDMYISLTTAKQATYRKTATNYFPDPMFDSGTCKLADQVIESIVNEHVSLAGGTLRQLDLRDRADLDEDEQLTKLKKFKPETSTANFPTSLFSGKPRDTVGNHNLLSFLLSTEQMWEFLVNVEHKHGWKYDYAMFLRDDTMWFHDFNLERIVTRYPDKNVYLTACDARKPRMDPFEVCDYFLMADRLSSDFIGRRYSALFDQPILDCKRSETEPGCNSEMLLNWQLLQMNFSLQFLNQLLIPFQRVGYVMSKEEGPTWCFHKHCQSIIEPMPDPPKWKSCNRLDPAAVWESKCSPPH